MAGEDGKRIEKSWDARDDVGGLVLARCLSRSWMMGHCY